MPKVTKKSMPSTPAPIKGRRQSFAAASSMTTSTPVPARQTRSVARRQSTFDSFGPTVGQSSFGERRSLSPVTARRQCRLDDSDATTHSQPSAGVHHFRGTRSNVRTIHSQSICVKMPADVVRNYANTDLAIDLLELKSQQRELMCLVTENEMPVPMVVKSDVSDDDEDAAGMKTVSVLCHNLTAQAIEKLAKSSAIVRIECSDESNSDSLEINATSDLMDSLEMDLCSPPDHAPAAVDVASAAPALIVTTTAPVRTPPDGEQLTLPVSPDYTRMSLESSGDSDDAAEGGMLDTTIAELLDVVEHDILSQSIEESSGEMAETAVTRTTDKSASSIDDNNAEVIAGQSPDAEPMPAAGPPEQPTKIIRSQSVSVLSTIVEESEPYRLATGDAMEIDETCCGSSDTSVVLISSDSEPSAVVETVSGCSGGASDCESTPSICEVMLVVDEPAAAAAVDAERMPAVDRTHVATAATETDESDVAILEDAGASLSDEIDIETVNLSAPLEQTERTAAIDDAPAVLRPLEMIEWLTPSPEQAVNVQRSPTVEDQSSVDQTTAMLLSEMAISDDDDDADADDVQLVETTPIDEDSVIEETTNGPESAPRLPDSMPERPERSVESETDAVHFTDVPAQLISPIDSIEEQPIATADQSAHAPSSAVDNPLFCDISQYCGIADTTSYPDAAQAAAAPAAPAHHVDHELVSLSTYDLIDMLEQDPCHDEHRLPSMPSLFGESTANAAAHYSTGPVTPHPISPILDLIPGLLSLGSATAVAAAAPTATADMLCCQPVANFTIHHTAPHQRQNGTGLTNLCVTYENLTTVPPSLRPADASASLVYQLMPADYHLYASAPGTVVGQSMADVYGRALDDVMGDHHQQQQPPQQLQPNASDDILQQAITNTFADAATANRLRRQFHLDRREIVLEPNMTKRQMRRACRKAKLATARERALSEQSRPPLLKQLVRDGAVRKKQHKIATATGTKDKATVSAVQQQLSPEPKRSEPPLRRSAYNTRGQAPKRYRNADLSTSNEDDLFFPERTSIAWRPPPTLSAATAKVPTTAAATEPAHAAAPPPVPVTEAAPVADASSHGHRRHKHARTKRSKHRKGGKDDDTDDVYCVQPLQSDQPAGPIRIKIQRVHVGKDMEVIASQAAMQQLKQEGKPLQQDAPAEETIADISLPFPANEFTLPSDIEENLETNFNAMVDYIEGIDNSLIDQEGLLLGNLITPPSQSPQLPSSSSVATSNNATNASAAIDLTTIGVPPCHPNTHGDATDRHQQQPQSQQQQQPIPVRPMPPSANHRQPPPPAHPTQPPAYSRAPPSPMSTRPSQPYFILRDPSGRRLVHIVHASLIDSTPLTADCVIDLSVRTGCHLGDAPAASHGDSRSSVAPVAQQLRRPLPNGVPPPIIRRIQDANHISSTSLSTANGTLDMSMRTGGGNAPATPDLSGDHQSAAVSMNNGRRMASHRQTAPTPQQPPQRLQRQPLLPPRADVRSGAIASVVHLEQAQPLPLTTDGPLVSRLPASPVAVLIDLCDDDDEDEEVDSGQQPSKTGDEVCSIGSNSDEDDDSLGNIPAGSDTVPVPATTTTTPPATATTAAAVALTSATSQPSFDMRWNDEARAIAIHDVPVHALDPAPSASASKCPNSDEHWTITDVADDEMPERHATVVRSVQNRLQTPQQQRHKPVDDVPELSEPTPVLVGPPRINRQPKSRFTDVSGAGLKLTFTIRNDTTIAPSSSSSAATTTEAATAATVLDVDTDSPLTAASLLSFNTLKGRPAVSPLSPSQSDEAVASDDDLISLFTPSIKSPSPPNASPWRHQTVDSQARPAQHHRQTAAETDATLEACTDLSSREAASRTLQKPPIGGGDQLCRTADLRQRSQRPDWPDDVRLAGPHVQYQRPGVLNQWPPARTSNPFAAFAMPAVFVPPPTPNLPPSLNTFRYPPPMILNGLLAQHPMHIRPSMAMANASGNKALPPPQPLQPPPPPPPAAMPTAVGPCHGKALYEALRLFERPCINHLQNRCPYPAAKCQYNHQLLTAEQVNQRLEAAATPQTLLVMYQFVHGHPVLFERYLAVFCAQFGRLRMRGQLEQMAGHCARVPQLLCHVVYGLITASSAGAGGEAVAADALTPRQAVRLVLRHSDGRRSGGTGSELIDAHVRLMLQTPGAGGCAEFVTELTAILDKVTSYRFQLAAVCDMVEAVLEGRQQPLMDLILRILEKDVELGSRLPYDRWTRFSALCIQMGKG